MGVTWCRSGEQATAGQQDKMQMIREEKLAANLKALLRRWVEGDQTGFRVRPPMRAPCKPCLLLPLKHACDTMQHLAAQQQRCVAYAV